MRYDDAREVKKYRRQKRKRKKFEIEFYRNVHIDRKYENRKIKSTSKQERKRK